MSKASKIIIAIIAVIVIAGGIWILMGSKTAESPPAPPADQSNQENEEATEETVALTITYDDTGFNPSTATVKSGEKIKITNQSDQEMELASNPHPAHTINPELNAGDIEPGGSKIFTVTAKGVWGFHNHYNPTKGGTLTVE